MTDVATDFEATEEQLHAVWIVAFVGHRPKSGERGRSAEALAACEIPIRDELLRLRDGLPESESIELMCSLAEGADHAAIRAAESLQIPVHVALPLPPDSFKLDFDVENEQSRRAWKDVERWLHKAEDPRSGWTVRLVPSAGRRPDCYYNVNQRMIEVADLLIAVCTEQSLEQAEKAAADVQRRSVGGTAEIVVMADDAHYGVPTVVLDPAKDGEKIRSGDLPSANDSVKHLRQLSEDMQGREAQPRQGRRLGEGQRGGPDAVWRVHQKMDNVANHTSRFFRRAFAWAICFHFIATILAATSAGFAKVLTKAPYIPSTLTFLELCFVVLATAVIWRAHASHTNERWRRARVAAELSDSHISAAGLVDPLRPLVLRHNPLLKRFVLALALRAHREKLLRLADLETGPRFANLRDEYLEQRVVGQIGYLKKQGGLASNRFDRWSKLAKFASLAAVIVIASALVVKVVYEDAGKDTGSALLTLFLPIFLPVVASFGSSMILAGDAARRSVRYRQVRQRLEQLRRLVPVIGTPAAMECVVTDTEDLLLDEIIEWHATTENLEHMHG